MSLSSSFPCVEIRGHSGEGLHLQVQHSKLCKNFPYTKQEGLGAQPGISPRETAGLRTTTAGQGTTLSTQPQGLRSSSGVVLYGGIAQA